MAVGIWFQFWGAAEETAWRPKSVFALRTYRRLATGTQRTTGLIAGYEIIKISRLLKTSFSQIRLQLWPDMSSEIWPNSAPAGFEKVEFGATLP